MNKLILSAFLLLSLSFIALSQNGTSAPAAWQRYQITDRKISIEFPKLPVVIARPVGCSELEKSSYFAYASEAVYELTIASKPKQVSANCRVNKKFGEALLVERLRDTARRV